MVNNINKEIIDSLNILGLNKESTKEQIVSRTKKLKAVYEDSNAPKDIAKLAEIDSASQILLTNFEILQDFNKFDEDNDDVLEESIQENTESMDNSEVYEDDPEVDSFVDDSKPEGFNKTSDQSQRSPLSPEQKRKYNMYGVIVAAILVIILAISIPLGITYSRQNKYYNIESMMMEFSGHNMNTIGEYINDLPYEYRDINNIKSKYQIIMREVNIIENHDVRTDYERMRTAYYNLVSLDNTTFTWDLSLYLDNVDNRILLYEIYWTNESYYFYYRPDPENTLECWLQTNLPNDKISNIDYCFTTNKNYTIFGFRNQNDETDEFDAFKILSIKEDELRIYCYSNQLTYTLSP